MTILIVGPSGIGKTSACELIQGRFAKCQFAHLDGLASRWAMRRGLIDQESVTELRSRINDNERFLAIGLEAIGHFAASTENHVIIDVGAGFQDAQSAQSPSQTHEVIAILADPETAYQRFLARHPRSRAEYMRVEFSEHRRRVYGNATHKIDTTDLTLQETGERLASVIRASLTGSRP